MKVVGFVPSKLNSQRLPRKNVLPLAGTPLVNHPLAALAAAGIDDVVLYAAEAEVTEYVDEATPYRYVQRPSWLDTDEATVQDFVGAFLDDVPCDVVVLLHITSPFIRPHTIRACVDAVTSGRHESAFAALEVRRFAWFEGHPLNYSLTEPTPRTQDLEPVLVEQSGLYVFTRELFERTRRRVADDPYVHVVDPIEGHDIDDGTEYAIAQALVAQGLAG